MTNIQSHTRAFTLVELLVVIAIIGMLIGLLLPAVQAAREAARRMQCTNNLKQMGVALHNHHDTLHAFPAGYATQEVRAPASSDWGDLPPGRGWGTLILPFMEQTALYDRLTNNNLSVWHTANAEAVRTNIPTFLCPSDPRSRELSDIEGGTEGVLLTYSNEGDGYTNSSFVGQQIRFGRSGYTACTGTEESWLFGGASDENPDPDGRDGGDALVRQYADGAFFRNSETTIGAIMRGTSNTIMIAESASSLGNKSWVGVHPDATVWCKAPDPTIAWEPPATLVLFHSGPALSEYADTGLVIIHGPNSPYKMACATSSYHVGGMNALYGDGSVRFISSTVDLRVFANSCTIAGVKSAWGREEGGLE